MGERIIYTCDICKKETSKKESFIKINKPYYNSTTSNIIDYFEESKDCCLACLYSILAYIEDLTK